LEQKVTEVLSETHREDTSPSSESNSWNQLINTPSTLLAFGVDLIPHKAQKGDTVTEERMKENNHRKTNEDE
jgi:hypothetical protein